jgi:hypothetical protein
MNHVAELLLRAFDFVLDLGPWGKKLNSKIQILWFRKFDDVFTKIKHFLQIYPLKKIQIFWPNFPFKKKKKRRLFEPTTTKALIWGCL